MDWGSDYYYWEKENMKIYIIGQKGIPATYGGIEKHVEEIAKRLAKKHEVFVFCRSYYTNFSGNNYKNVNLIKLPTIRTKYLDTVVHAFLCYLYVLPRKADIIHVHAYGPSLFLPLLKLKRKTKIIATVHGIDWKRAKWGRIASAVLKMGERLIAKYSDIIIVISESLKNYYQKTYQKKTFFIPNGVVVYPMKPLKNMMKYNLEAQKYILSVARLVPEKGIHYLLEAFKGIRTDMKLAIVGGSSHSISYINNLKKIAQDYKNIIFTGYLYNDDLQELYSNDYLYVQPSELEGGVPITLLDALSFNNAVLVSDIPEQIEIVKNKLGFSFRAGDANSLKKQLETIIASPELIVGIKKNKPENYVRKHFSWDESVKKIEILYQQR